MAAHPQARFAGSTTVSGGTVRSPIADALTPVAHLAGELAASHRAHAVITDAADATELVLVANEIYVRVAPSATALPAESYRRADKQTSRIMRVRAEQAKTLDVATLLAAATTTKTIGDHGADTIVESRLDPQAVFGRALAAHVESMSLRVLVGTDGTVSHLLLVTRGEATLTNRLAFSGWGARDIAVAPPLIDQIDTTPAVAVATLAAFRATPLLMPKALPATWHLVRADVLSANDTEEGCAQVELAYEDQSRGNGGYLYLYEFPQSCAVRPGDATPFSAGEYGGFSASADRPYVQITVGTTTVQAVTDLSPETLARTLSALVPLALRSS